MQRAFAGDAWHGASLSELLEGVESDTASARPIDGAHTIRELVLHVIAWQDEAVRRIEGNGSDLPPEEDWPGGAAGWSAIRDALNASHERLIKAMASLDDSALTDSVLGTGGTIYHLLHGVVQHNLYHGGQIAILKRAMSK